jgi:hypothetical protein
MIRVLDGLVLLKSLSSYCDTTKLEARYKNSIVILRKIKYIYKDVLPQRLKDKSESLDDCVSYRELCDRIGISNNSFLYNDIKLMEISPIDISLFEFKKIQDIYFIKLNQEQKELFLNFQPFVVKKDSVVYAKAFSTIGSLKLGFY